ncbi:hypothetical protein DPMN_043948 [Dreissena polymorpha]|uniref:Uncharacterized protein n=1 Tax=Dreissena polymorpha TaxID=45954 RepID=A0A9D4HW27_DREPO|nr:hypothetical protein DPMN_043948 [Dreissena polymorpha]
MVRRPLEDCKMLLSKDGYKDVNKVEDADFNGIVNVLINCELFKMFFKDDLTQKENVCTKARDVGRDVRHAPSMSMTSQDSDRAIDTLIALLQSLKHVNHQVAANTAVDKLTQLKNGTLAITTEDVDTTFELLKENLIAKIKEALEKEKDTLVKEMVDAFNKRLSKVIETIQRKENDLLKTVKRKRDNVLDTIDEKRDDVIETVKRKKR